jgi:DNA polymerase III delta prime subunit
MKELWVEKYRPSTVDGYVFRDDHQRNQINTWIRDKSIPHLLLSGSAGIGKTTLAKILIHEIGIEDYDVLEINASRTNSVDDVRDKITNFVQMIPFGPFKVVLLDEADYLSPNAQAALRGVMEEYHATARFILTCNYPNRIIPAIHSRCQSFHVERTDMEQFISRVEKILTKENIMFDLESLANYVSVTYPDLRKCINMVQQNINEGVLQAPNKGDAGEADWKFDMVQLFNAGKITEARKMLCGKLRAEEMEEVYRWLYDNLNIFGSDDNQDKAIIIIKSGLVDHTVCADPEINLAATLVRLSKLNV